MSEKNYVVNVKTNRNTIVTVRGDSAAELANNVNGLIQQGLNEHISVLEEVFLGAGPSAPVTQSPVALVAAAMGGTVVAEVARPQLVAVTQPATSAQGPAPSCRHGQMEWVDLPNKPWKGWFCPQPKVATDKCAPQFAKG